MAQVSIAFTFGQPGHALAHLTLDAVLHIPSDDDEDSQYLTADNLGWLVDELGMALVRCEHVGLLQRQELTLNAKNLLERYEG